MAVAPLETLAHAAGVIAQRAAAAILEVYGRDFAVTHKDDRSPLTAADLAAHNIIVAALCELDPDLPVLSEESANIPWSERSRWSRYWLVDPLDGTREFVKRNGEFTVNIALIENREPIIGIVQTPVTGELATAWRGGGAWLATRGEPAKRITTRKRAAPFIVAGSRSHGSEREIEMLARLGAFEKQSMGSSLKFLHIAAGKADLYLRLGLTSEWDTAAGQCVLEQAGGAVLDLHGQPFRYNRGESLLNPEFVAVGDRDADWSVLFDG